MRESLYRKTFDVRQYTASRIITTLDKGYSETRQPCAFMNSRTVAVKRESLCSSWRTDSRVARAAVFRMPSMQDNGQALQRRGQIPYHRHCVDF